MPDLIKWYAKKGQTTSRKHWQKKMMNLFYPVLWIEGSPGHPWQAQCTSSWRKREEESREDQYFDKWTSQTQLLDSPCVVPLRIRWGDTQQKAPPMPLVLPHWLPPMKRTSLILLFKLTKHSSEPLPCQEMFSWEKILCNEVSKQPLTMFLRALSQHCRESAQCRENTELGIWGLYSGQSSIRSLRKEPGIWLQIEIQILALAFSSCMT